MVPVEQQNPFNELYLSEAIEHPAVYSRWFSPTIITGETETLFRKGNAVLRGSNGIGKTMLLRLFSPEVRAAYLEDPADFVFPHSLEKTIGLNVNFLHTGFGALGMRALDKDETVNRDKWGLVFGDLLNYYIVEQLVGTLVYLNGPGRLVADGVGIRLSTQLLDRFASVVVGDPCWFGALGTVSTVGGLRDALRKRIECYRAFINWNIARLPPEITRTKTVIGAPILTARAALLVTEIMDDDTDIAVTLDQYESLYHVDYGGGEDPEATMGSTLCRVANSLLAQRRPGVSFKIGVRHYAWKKEIRGFHTDQRLELGRDYQLIDLDKVLRREENQKSWIFPAFASDVAARRIAVARGGNAQEHHRWLRDRLETLKPEQEIAKYSRRNTEKLRPDVEDSWPDGWCNFLGSVFELNQYRAKLTEVWVRQTLGQGRELPEVPQEHRRWTPWAKAWWEKERREALLAQIASDCQQRKLYAGWRTLLTLSGGNILIFINLCREIWDHWGRAEGTADATAKISADIQSQAVRIVASDWLNKQEETPRGATRRNFVVRLGIGMRAALMADRTLSYPGRTGFSLLRKELEEDPALDSFLEAAVEYGALIRRPHTTKEKDRAPRLKWYLSPILCPNFEIPAIRTKEPYYASAHEVRTWIAGTTRPIVFGRQTTKRASAAAAPSLFKR